MNISKPLAGLFLLFAGLFSMIIIASSGADAAWVTSTIDSVGSMGQYNSIAVDSNNKAHISYYKDLPAGDLRYATSASGAWVLATPDATNDVGLYSSIAIDSNNKVHISHYNVTTITLKYSTNASGAWVHTNLGGGNAWFTSIAIDTAGKAHISYYDAIAKDLRYVTNASGAWVGSTIDSTGSVGSYPSIAIDSTGKLHISYHDETNGALKYATNASGAWVVSTIDNTIGGIAFQSDTSLAIDSTDKLHISYYDLTNTALKYATNASGAWVVSTIDSTGTVGSDSSLAIDSTDKLHISYYDLTNTALKYATNASGAWVVSTIDSTGTVGSDSSLAVDSANNIHISYYDGSNSDLKYAYLAEAAPPTVTSTTPANAATGVAVNSAITATFSEAMNAATINTTNFTISGGATGTVTYNAGTNTATFTPSANLADGTTYTATISTGVTDSAGNAMAATYTWSFTTVVQQYTLTVTKSGTGTGDVTAGASCTLVWAGTGTCTVNSGTGITLSGAATGGSTFGGWSGATGSASACTGAGSCAFNITAASVVTATFVLTAPGAPTGVTAIAGNARAFVNFTAPASTGGSTITGYTATSSPGGFTSSGCTGSPCTVTGLTNGTAYTFTVTATNAVGTSAASTVSNSVTPSSTAYLLGGAIQGTAINVEPSVVSTFAGTAGSFGSTDGTGAAARLYSPYGITTDGINLYVADASNSTIRKIVISTGVVTTIAGTALTSGSTDGTGAAARFYFPFGITTDGTNLYVADTYNHTIRKIVISTGVVTTIAGTAGSFGSTDGTGAAARLYSPYGITTDGINLYVADASNSTIRKIVISTGVVTTIAGTALTSGSTDGTGAAARFYFPFGITTDGTNLYVADTYNHTIRKIVISSGVVTTIAGTAGSAGSADGTGAAARFYRPFGITIDGFNLYVDDSYNHTIRKIVISSGVVTTIAGTAGSFGSTDGTGVAARFYRPFGITTDGTNLFICDTYNHTIRVTTKSTHTITPTVTGIGTITPAGPVEASPGGTIVFTMSPGVMNVIVDGVSLGAMNMITFKNVTGPHTLNAVY